jgi:hypothetical protein
MLYSIIVDPVNGIMDKMYSRWFEEDERFKEDMASHEVPRRFSE